MPAPISTGIEASVKGKPRYLAMRPVAKMRDENGQAIHRQVHIGPYL